MVTGKQKRVNHELARLEVIGPVELQLAWEEQECTRAPNIGTGLLRCLLAYRLQERHLGGLPAVISRELDRAASGSARQAVHAPRPVLTPGALLIREWQGRTISVTVTEAGFLYDGRDRRSLSEIAREVTGAHWSGPRFFGLTGRG